MPLSFPSGEDEGAMAFPRRVTRKTDDETGIDLGLLFDRLPHYLVKLHDDDVHSMDYVVECLIRCIPGTPKELAVSIMLTAHESGEAIAFAGLQEEAEHFGERLSDFGLDITVVPA